MSTNRTEAVIERIRASIGVNTDAGLCRTLGLKPQTLSGWKSRDSIPYELCEQIAGKYEVSIDWLLTGEGPMYPIGPACASGSTIQPRGGGAGDVPVTG